MNRKTFTFRLIAILLCISIVLSIGLVANGTEIQDSTVTSGENQTPAGGGEGAETPPTEGGGADNTEPPGTEGPETPPAEGEDPVTPPEGGENPDNPPEGGENPDNPPEGGEDPDNPPEGGENPDAPPEDTTMKVSDELLRVLKQLEGFNEYAYWDNKQWSIGYGSKCPEGYESYYQKHPISVEYAEQLLREELDFFEEKINGFITKNELTISQHQYDALVSFTYNVGANWTTGTTGNFNSAVISGDSGSHMLYGMMLWSMAGKRHILINRRILELNMYANGVYPEDVFAADVVPDRYRIAFMDGNGGQVKYEEHGFDAEQPIAIKTKFNSYPTGPDETGAIVTYVLDGWYTERIGGTKVEILDTSVPTGTVLYAHWKTPGGTPVVIPQQTSDLKVTVTVTADDVNVRSGPETYYASLRKANTGEVLEIVEVMKRGSLLWGRFGDTWISLKYTDYDEQIAKVLPKWGKVTSSTLNVRTGAGTDYALVSGVQKKQGDLLLITEWKSDESMLWTGMVWGKIAEGWVALPYVTFEGVLPPNQTAQSIEIIQKPTKLTYIQQVEELDITGGKLLVTFADGSTASIDMTTDMISGFDNATVGTNTVTVTYGDKTAAFDVEIVKAKVTFQMEDGTVISEQEYLFGDTIEIPADPTKESDNIYNYVFAGWDKEVVPCAGNAVYTATFTPVYVDYTVVFKNDNGDVLSEMTYHWGDTITVPANPTKEADDTYTYAFAGWDKEVTTVCAGHATYTATYNPTYKEYTVTFQYEDGTVIQQFTLHYGDSVVPPANPAAPDGYQFTGWDKAIVTCQGDATYTAVFALRDHIPGDLDGNGEVNTDDVYALLLHISLPDMFPIKGNADFNGDGNATTDDVFQLLLHISLPDMFPL